MSLPGARVMVAVTRSNDGIMTHTSPAQNNKLKKEQKTTTNIKLWGLKSIKKFKYVDESMVWSLILGSLAPEATRSN